MSFYVEAVLGLNFAIDLILLVLVGLGLGLPLRPARLCCGALAGALYALLHLCGVFPLASSVPAKAAAGILMVYLAFRPTRPVAVARAFGLLCLESMAAGGLVLAMSAVHGAPGGAAAAAGGVIFVGAGARRLLPAALAGAALLAYLCGGVLRRTAFTHRSCCRSTVVVGGRRATLRALLDTGNELVDPLTRRPVLVAEYAAVSGLLPPRLRPGFAGGRADVLLGREACGPSACGNGREDDGWARRLRVLPFRSLGAENGMLLGFRPDAVLVRAGDGTERRLEGLLVAVSPRPLGTAGVYQGLLPASALH